MHNKIKKTSFIVLGFFIILTLVFSYRHIQIVRAEQSGGTPESGSTSRLVTLSTALTTLTYGSTAAGAWGDWGTSWNRIYSAATKPFNDALKSNGLKNGGNTDYPQSVGGIDDYNNNGTIPTDSYQSTWTTCNADNSYCNTGRAVAEKKDENTGLVWSPRISSSSNWFVANNCDYPNGLGDGVCDTHNELACKCVKDTDLSDADNTTAVTCERYDGGGWRLPTQKELMMSYIDGSWAKLTNAANFYWSSTTFSPATQNSWYTNQLTGSTTNATKTNAYSVRCVR
jgi:hypothetical protein